MLNIQRSPKLQKSIKLIGKKCGYCSSKDLEYHIALSCNRCNKLIIIHNPEDLKPGQKIKCVCSGTFITTVNNPQTEEVFYAKCIDCHSTSTGYCEKHQKRGWYNPSHEKTFCSSCKK